MCCWLSYYPPSKERRRSRSVLAERNFNFSRVTRRNVLTSAADALRRAVPALFGRRHRLFAVHTCVVCCLTPPAPRARLSLL